MISRRSLLKGLAATAAGVLIPGGYDPERRIWALDQSMIDPRKELLRAKRDMEQAILYGDYEAFSVLRYQGNIWWVGPDGHARVVSPISSIAQGPQLIGHASPQVGGDDRWVASTPTSKHRNRRLLIGG